MLPFFVSMYFYLCLVKKVTTMASTIEKQTWLVDTISRHGRISLKDLSRIWENNDTLNPDGLELSERTFHRHREEISRIFGIDIKCDKRDMNRYYIDDEVDGKEVRSWLLSTISVDSMLNQSKDLRDRIQFETIPSGQKYLSMIISAMRDGLKLRMTYHSFWRRKDDEVLLEPYFVKVDNQRWYVIGPSDIHPKDPHIYSLDRIISLEPTTSKFKYPKSFDPYEYFSDDFGIFHSEEPVRTILLKVAKYQCNYIETLPLHTSQVKVEEGEDYNVYQLRLKPNYQFYKAIVSGGPDYEVLEPAAVRKEVADWLREALDHYADVSE